MNVTGRSWPCSVLPLASRAEDLLVAPGATGALAFAASNSCGFSRLKICGASPLLRTSHISFGFDIFSMTASKSTGSPLRPRRCRTVGGYGSLRGCSRETLRAPVVRVLALPVRLTGLASTSSSSSCSGRRRTSHARKATRTTRSSHRITVVASGFWRSNILPHFPARGCVDNTVSGTSQRRCKPTPQDTISCQPQPMEAMNWDKSGVDPSSGA
mmetsp:Transcript_143141/g.398868  ORF Transcript_143141/g.398868 Transcript_143141/m.398868 type:complete len:214 (-) Transcript_143141:1-642(-)